MSYPPHRLPIPGLSDPAKPAPTWLSWEGATANQRTTLIITWLTWVLGAMDAMLYSMALTPALQELLSAGSSATVSTAMIGWYGGIIFSVFLIGWAVGGVLLGSWADDRGRTTVLIMAIILIGVSTGLAALSKQWWHLACLRLLTGMGIGGLWAAGAALVAETWADRHRAKAAAFLQSAWGFGFFAAAAVTYLLKDFGWRGSFAIGLLTIISAWLVHHRVQEPPQWQRIHMRALSAHHRSFSNIRRLFAEDLRRSTWTGAGLAFVAVFGLWGATNWTPSLVQSIPDLQNLQAPEMATHVSLAVMVLNAGALAGYFSFGWLAGRFGRKTVFAFMNAGSLILLPCTFFITHSYAVLLGLLPLVGFFSKGVFGGFPLYLPELFPTNLRSTGAGFCYNAGRIVASASPFMTGAMVGLFGSFGRAASAVACVYLLGLAILPWAPETKDQPLAD